MLRREFLRFGLKALAVLGVTVAAPAVAIAAVGKAGSDIVPNEEFSAVALIDGKTIYIPKNGGVAVFSEKDNPHVIRKTSFFDADEGKPERVSWEPIKNSYNTTFFRDKISVAQRFEKDGERIKQTNMVNGQLMSIKYLF